MSLGNDVTTGEDIEKAIENKIRGTSVAPIEPKRNVGKIVDTIAGVSNWYSWKWPIDEESSGFIFAHELPNVGDWISVLCRNPKKEARWLQRWLQPGVANHFYMSQIWLQPSSKVATCIYSTYPKIR